MNVDVDLARRLRGALQEVGFTYNAVSERLGVRAHAALGRNETTPGLMRTTTGDPVDTLTRLFLLQAPVTLDQAEAALPGLVDRLAVAGLVECSIAEVRARLDVRPYASDDLDLWVVSDLTPGLDGGPNVVGADHVLGITPASTSLAQLTRRRQVGSALDLGTGCGVQALHLATHYDRVVATDVNQRALWLTGFNTALNDIDGIEVRDGSFFEPVKGERFDLIATNPPFVISPASGERLVYRDSGLPGDRVVEDIMRKSPDHLNPGGWCQILANWVIARDKPWGERLEKWLDDDVTALVVQREVIDPAAYVELWLKDAGQHGAPDYVRRYDTWLSWFDEQGVEGIGFGWINLTPQGGHRRFLEWPYAVEQPIAPALTHWGDAVGAEVRLEDTLIARADVLQETTGAPGAEDPETIVIRQQTGLRRARQVDTVEAAFVGACDGDLTVGQILDAIATLTDQESLPSRYLNVIGALVEEGFLTTSQTHLG